MIFQCNDLDRALRSSELMPDARAHAEHCPECAEQLYLWSEMSRLAPGLHREWDSPSLWPRIESGLKAAAPARKPVPVWRWALAAAALVALAVTLTRTWPVQRPQDRDFLTEETLRDVERAETAYAKSIERLSGLASSSLNQSAAPLAAAYREKLVLLDSAITEIKSNIETNRHNVYLQNQLASLYREKQKTLKDWLENTRLENAKRNSSSTDLLLRP
jgi:hypothetical protein